MAIPLLHIPLDFEMREDVCRLAIAFPEDPALALAIVLRLWANWGRAGKEWRALDFADGAPWEKEPLTSVLERAAQYPGATGNLIALCVAAGVLVVEKRGDIRGLVLNDFWRFNEHLSPDFKTMQERGGRIKAQLGRARAAEALAPSQVKLMESNGNLDLFAADASPEQKERATGLVMKLDAVCGLPMRDTASFLENKPMLARALAAVRSYTLRDIDSVCRYVIARRDDPAVPREPDEILARFGELLRKTK